MTGQELPKGYVCYRAAKPLTINGRLDDAAWNAAPWTDDFLDIQGGSLPKPRFRTRAKMLWDDEYLYIGAELEEPHVWATLTEHDSVIFHDNDFEVFMDPDGDNHDYYEIEINALNTEWDLRLVKPYRDGGPALNEWEIPGFKSAVQVNGTLNDPSDVDHGWSVEMAIPWRVLGEFARRPSPPRHGDQWRINFSRVEWQIDTTGGKYTKTPRTPEDNWVWSPQGVIDMHRPERWGYLQFSTASPGTDEFHRDPREPAWNFLMSVYYAQQDYKKREGKWARTLDELGLKIPAGTALSDFKLATDDTVFTASMNVAADGASERWAVREDSRLWQVKPPIETGHP